MCGSIRQIRNDRYGLMTAVLLGISLATFVSCGAKVRKKELAEAMVVVDRMQQLVERSDYRAAMSCFTDRAQKRIRKVGGNETPIEGFFFALKQMMRHDRSVRITRGKVWVTYAGADGADLNVGLNRFGGNDWLIFYMKGDGWGI